MLMAGEKLRILLIAGDGRSGSTLLDNILGQTEGFFSSGELGNLWNFAQAEERVCSCGSCLRDCEIWKGVFRRILGDVDLGYALSKRPRDRFQYMRSRDFWRLTSGRGRKRFLQLTSAQAREVVHLYGVISAESGARTIVDSSKSSARAYMITQIPDLDVYVVHLVRDPRAVAFSWARKKPDPSLPGTYMDTYGPVRSALRWVARQQVEPLCNIPGRYLLIRYEDFIATPDREIQRIFAMIGDDARQGLKLTNRPIMLRPVHSIDGNPSRFNKEPLILKPDDEWRRRMSRFDHAVVTALAWPLLRRYGYALNMRPYVQGVEAAFR
jgi:hypothetical protein